MLILGAIFMTAMWIRSFWKMDDLGFEHRVHQHPGVVRYLRFHSVSGAVKFSVGAARDAPGTADLAVRPEDQPTPGFDWFHNIGLNPMSHSYGRWWQQEDYFSIPGFGLSRHGSKDSHMVSRGWLVTTQPFTTRIHNGYSIWVPHPLLIVAMLIWPIRRWRRLRRLQQRGRAGLCLSCGYDLRATPDQCPECGHVARAPHSG
jgi:hypothetical protein